MSTQVDAHGQKVVDDEDIDVNELSHQGGVVGVCGREDCELRGELVEPEVCDAVPGVAGFDAECAGDVGFSCTSGCEDVYVGGLFAPFGGREAFELPLVDAAFARAGDVSDGGVRVEQVGLGDGFSHVALPALFECLVDGGEEDVFRKLICVSVVVEECEVDVGEG